jgi:hypothetical protein
VDDQGFHVCHVGQERENLQRIDEPEGLVFPALDLKGENGAAAVFEISLVEGMVRMVRERGMIYLLYQRMSG